MARLTWNGSLRAQAAADDAYRKLKPKRKRRGKNSRHAKRSRTKLAELQERGSVDAEFQSLVRSF